MHKSFPQATGAGAPQNQTKNDKKVEKLAENVATKAENPTETAKKTAKKSKNRANIIMVVLGIAAMLGGIGMAVASWLTPEETLAELSFPQIPSKTAGNDNIIYSNLTGLALAEGQAQNAPAYCVQVPNGTDGARPQAGLNDAGVVFEAVAEAGITRFAAVFQDPTTAIIGPIRSLRIYYLEWDTPFGCTIVHAGGSDDALAAVAAGGYKDLTENYAYMYRGTYGTRRWNNLFTTSAYLRQMSADRGYNSSNVKGFARMTPTEAERDRIERTVREKLVVTEPATGSTNVMTPSTTQVALNFGGWATFNVVYNYDVATNRYLRSYATGAAHEVYDCGSSDLGERNPEDLCSLTQMAPSVVVAMVVSEKRASDNYHENITVLGSGTAYIFQNGYAVRGSWVKGSDAEQIRFFDDAGAEVALVPGQAFVSAVPTYGGVEY